ncbi:MAG: [protein-PII] uridylyltransferase [Rhodocyclaceae bacterium]|nr:[protein-PII] uridylyltransferase [Rhodocyclaceae bacterium]
MPQATATAETQALITEYRNRLGEGQKALAERYTLTHNAKVLLQGRARLVDATLRKLWSDLGLANSFALVASGGYGRGELYPCSDVDLLLLVPAGCDPAHEPAIERLIGMLWDIGLDVGHSVRTIDQCVEEAGQDITVQTSLLEARLLAGNKALFTQLTQALGEKRDPALFFKAKQLEQTERYARYNDTPYALEPNCKESPGGLRDLQVILWVSRAAGLGNSWAKLAEQELVTQDEARQLGAAESFLRQLRSRLHQLVKRKEDRLLFDYQEALAQAMDCAPTSARRASEVLMQRYYRNAKLVTQLNTLVLQNLAVRLMPRSPVPPLVIDNDFQTIRERLDIRDPELFERKPTAILQSFLILEQRGELKGMTTRTLRALWRARDRIDTDFRRDPENRRLFLKLFQQPHLIHELRRMNQYDILGHYLPAFGRIVGQMQHDLFHVYTVDQHIMQVIRNLRRFTMPEFAHEYPFCSRLMSGFERRWLLYIAALFHDIAKGRGGDHSKQGMADAREFCVDHEIDAADGDLVVFLVEHHLTMSQIAQKKDLSDPDVVRRFASVVGNQRRLTALYLLTVADIRGTSPKVWNVWKGKLLEDLFRMTSRQLSGEATTPLAGVSENQEEARALLRKRGLRSGIEAPFWEHLDTVYFMRHDADEIAWHTRNLYYRPDTDEPVVRARLSPIGAGLQVMAYLRDQPDLFARLCGFFARHGYSIVDAKIHTTRHGYALDSFVILDTQEHLPYRDVIALIEHELSVQLQTLPPLGAPQQGRLPRQVKHFPLSPEVEIRPDEKGNRFVMSISAADRPGLLFLIARILGRHGVTFHTAKVATLGERVEDTFLISGQELEKSATLVHIEEELLEALQT